MANLAIFCAKKENIYPEHKICVHICRTGNDILCNGQKIQLKFLNQKKSRGNFEAINVNFQKLIMKMLSWSPESLQLVATQGLYVVIIRDRPTKKTQLCSYSSVLLFPFYFVLQHCSLLR